MPRAHINIGSNIGDRFAQIEQAVAAIKERIDSRCLTSGYYHSHPQGFDSNNDFINLGVTLETSLEPLQLLRELQSIEKEIDATSHRDADGLYIDRKIDIDLITFGNWELQSYQLILPHPRMAERDFVMIPMRELEERLKRG